MDARVLKKKNAISLAGPPPMEELDNGSQKKQFCRNCYIIMTETPNLCSQEKEKKEKSHYFFILSPQVSDQRFLPPQNITVPRVDFQERKRDTPFGIISTRVERDAIVS